MKISELILQLEAKLQSHGDVNVILEDDYGAKYEIDEVMMHNGQVEIIGIEK